MGTIHPPDPPIYTNSDKGAQPHLDWLFQVDHMLHAFHYFGKALYGANEGIVVTTTPWPATPTELRTVELSTPGMAVDVNAGLAYLQDGFFYLPEKWTSATLLAPTGDFRKDTVQIDVTTQVVSIKTGSEGNATAPLPDATALAIAEIYHRVGETQIDDTDGAGSDGYITNAGAYANG